MAVSFEGFHVSVATFKAAEGLKAGEPVKAGSNDTAAACAEGDAFCGVAIEADGSYASVQLSGYAVLPYSGDTAPEAGYCQLAADGEGGVKIAETGGRSLLVLHVNTTAKTAGVLL